MAPITVIVGEFSGKNVARIERLGWGRCFIDRLRSHKVARPYWASEPWILDNGAWPARNAPGGLIDTEQWFYRVWDVAHNLGEQPLFAVLPDIVAGGQRSFELSSWYLSAERLGDEGELPEWWNWYLAVQDGMSLEQVEELLRDQQENPEAYQVRVAGLFVGGSDTWKESTVHEWAALARRWGIGCHFGRCSSVRKLRLAVAAGCTSCDSTQMLWTVPKFRRFALAWLELAGLEGDAELRTWVEQGAPVEELPRAA